MYIRKHSPILLTTLTCLIVSYGGIAQGFARDPLLVVTNKGDQTLSIIDPKTNKQIATVREDGVTGHEVATSLDGLRAFVPIFGNAGVGTPGTDGQLIRVIDLQKREIVGTVDFAKGVRPHCPIMNAKNGLLYVTTELENSVSIIDPASLKIVGSIPTGQAESHMLALNHAGTRGYTANVKSGTVSVMDLEAKKLIKIIPVSGRVQRISVSMDDRWVFTADHVKPRLAAIDSSTNEVGKWIDLPDSGYGMAPTPDGKWLLVTLININEVGLINLETMKLEKTVSVPRSPQAVVVSPDGKTAYVSCDASKKVAVINLADWKVETLIDAGSAADGIAWAVGE